MKKLINDPKAVVDESVEGFGLAHADLVTVFPDPKYIVRKDAPVAGGWTSKYLHGHGTFVRARMQED